MQSHFHLFTYMCRRTDNLQNLTLVFSFILFQNAFFCFCNIPNQRTKVHKQFKYHSIEQNRRIEISLFKELKIEGTVAFKTRTSVQKEFVRMARNIIVRMAHTNGVKKE